MSALSGVDFNLVVVRLVVAGPAQVDIGLFGIRGVVGFSVGRVSGQFRRISCRNFPEFLLTVAYGRTLLLRPGTLYPPVSRVRHAVEILDRMSGFMRYGHL